jgi:DNA polymerase-4
MAKVASDLDKPDGLVVVEPGREQQLLRPMSVKVIPGVGPATAERLRRMGVTTVADIESRSEEELVLELGASHGHGLWRLARALDERPVVAEREAKSVSVEGTYEEDLTDRRVMEAVLTRQASSVATRLLKHGLSGRTISIKVRLHDFTTLSRSTTLASPTDSAATIARLARTMLGDLDPTGGVRLLGVGVSGLADWVQDDLFGSVADPEPEEELPELPSRMRAQWWPGQDVVHASMGRGWVWGAGRGVVTVRFETAETGPGPVRSYKADDPELSPWTRPADDDEVS